MEEQYFGIQYAVNKAATRTGESRNAAITNARLEGKNRKAATITGIIHERQETVTPSAR